MTKTKTILAGCAAAFIAISGGIGAAEAGHGRRGHHFHKFHNFHSYGWRGHGYGWRGGHGCGYYKRMWWRTGDYYWKRKYYDCVY